MKKFLTNLKKNYIYLIFAILPVILFFLPIYTRNIKESGELLTHSFNVYQVLDFNLQPIFSSVVVVIFVCCLINLITFIIYMCDGYKLPLIKREFNIFMLIVNCFCALCCLGILGFSIYFATMGGTSEGISYYYSLHCGSIILSVFEIILCMFLIRKNYHKELIEK